MEGVLKEVQQERFKVVGHLLAQCEICDAIVRTSSRARHRKTVKHWQAKNTKIWICQYFMDQIEGEPLEN
jgi:hypothetical protein